MFVQQKINLLLAVCVCLVFIAKFCCCVPTIPYPFNIYGDSSTGICENRVHRECLVETQFTAEELEIARVYIQSRFQITHPLRPACQRLRVRRDIKCLTPQELYDFLAAMQEMYRSGQMDNIALVHGTYWPNIHKFVEALPWHRWQLLDFEKRIQRINPKVMVPYWDYSGDGTNPERSIIWDYMGRGGRPENGYCVEDGVFAGTVVRYPAPPHCLRRQWTADGRIPDWEGYEWMSSILQQARNFTELRPFFAFTAHFKGHLGVGGFYGDYALQEAPNDPVFFPYHAYTDYIFLKYQLSDDARLVPREYNEAMRLDQQTGLVVRANVDTDTLTYFSDVLVKEAMQQGYGELCWVHDRMVRPINNLFKNIQMPPPVALVRLQQSLGPLLFSQYYPRFATGTASAMDYELPDAGQCPRQRQMCRPLPLALPYNSTDNGRRQLQIFRFDAGVDEVPMVFMAEDQYYTYMSLLQYSGYCSPYAN